MKTKLIFLKVKYTINGAKWVELILCSKKCDFFNAFCFLIGLLIFHITKQPVNFSFSCVTQRKYAREEIFPQQRRLVHFLASCQLFPIGDTCTVLEF